MHDPPENPGRSRDARNKYSAEQRFREERRDASYGAVRDSMCGKSCLLARESIERIC